jgi:hypothetical protein
MEDQWAMARDYSAYGDMMVREGDYRKADELFRKAAPLWEKMGNRTGISACLTGFAQIAARQARQNQAARFYGVIGTPIRTLGYLFLPFSSVEYEDKIAEIKQTVSETQWKKEYESGQSMTIEQALKYAQERQES